MVPESTTMAYELPSTNVVCLYSVENAVDPEVTGEIYQYFKTKGGYSIDYDPNVSIAKLKHLRPDCSVLFLNTHGVHDNNNLYEALGSGTHTLSEISDDKLRQELQQDMDHNLIYETGSHHLAITFELIRQNWRFPKNSFVFINGCMSFIDALQNGRLSSILKEDCHAGVVGGWTQYSTPTADFGITYLFDRLLGTNARRDDPHREEPSQRPFDWVSIFQRMKDLGLDMAPILSEHGEKTIPTQMRIEPNGIGEFGLLAPSIEFVQFDEKEKTAELKGFFGSGNPPIRVFVRESQDRASSDPGYELTCDPPDGSGILRCTGLPDDGPGSAGYLVAAADYGDGRFVESNPVPITAWKGKITLTFSVPGETSESEIGQIDTEVFLRGDIHWARNKPGEVPKPRYAAFEMVRDTNLPQFRSGGKYTSGEPDHYTYTWHGSGPLQKGESNGSGGFVDFLGLYQFPADPKHPKLMFLMLTGFEEAVVDVVDKDENEVVSNCTSPINIMYLANELHPPDPFITDFLQDSRPTWDPSFDIPAQCISHLIDYPIINGAKVVTAKLEWTGLEAKYAPDDQTQA